MDGQRQRDGIARAYAEHRAAKMVPEKRIVRETSCPRNVCPGIVLSENRL